MQIWNNILSRLLDLQTGGFTYLHKITGAQIGVTGATYTTAYTLGTGNPLAIKILRSQTGTGILQSVCIQDLSKQDGAIDLVFFDSNPSATTFTNNAALDINDADLPKIIGSVSIESTDYSDFADSSSATKTGIGLVLKSYTAPYDTIWMAVVSRDAKTYVANELSISLGILQD